MRETHEAIERHAIIREVDRLCGCDAERVCGEREASDGDVVLDDVALDVACPVSYLERLAEVLKRRRALGPEEGVGALETRESQG